MPQVTCQWCGKPLRWDLEASSPHAICEDCVWRELTSGGKQDVEDDLDWRDNQDLRREG